MLRLEELEARDVAAAPDFGGVAHAVLATPDLDFIYTAGRGGGPRVVVQDAGGYEQASFYAFEPEFQGGIDAVYLPERGELWVGANDPGGPVIAVFDLHGIELDRRYVGDPDSRMGVRLSDHLPTDELVSIGAIDVEFNPFANVDYTQWNDVSGGWGEFSVAVRGERIAAELLPSEVILAIWDAGGDGFDYRIAVGYGTPPVGVDLVIDALPGELALSLARKIVTHRS